MDIRRIVIISLLVFICSFIVYNSHQPATISDGQSIDISSWFAPYIIPGFNTQTPAEQEVSLLWLNHIIRDIAHMVEYFPIGLLGMTLSKERKWRLVIGLCAIFAASDEIHQFFIRGRGAQVSDWAEDMIGVIAGMLAYYLLSIPRKKARR